MTQALLVIDMQKDFFVDPQLEARRDELTSACNDLIRRAREQSCPVVEIQTLHTEDKSTWAPNM